MSELELQDSQGRNCRLIEEFVEALPPMSAKRQEERRRILRKVSSRQLERPFDNLARLDLKRIMAGIDTAGVKSWRTGQYKPLGDWTTSAGRIAS